MVSYAGRSTQIQIVEEAGDVACTEERCNVRESGQQGMGCANW